MDTGDVMENHEDEDPRTYKYNCKSVGLAVFRCLLAPVPWLVILLGVVIDLAITALVILPMPTGRLHGRHSEPPIFFLIAILMSICPVVAFFCSISTNQLRQKTKTSPVIKMIVLLMIGYAVFVALLA